MDFLWRCFLCEPRVWLQVWVHETSSVRTHVAGPALLDVACAVAAGAFVTAAGSAAQIRLVVVEACTSSGVPRVVATDVGRVHPAELPAEEGAYLVQGRVAAL